MPKTDKIFELIKNEEMRQSSTLMMIPSENYTYPEVHKAVGSVLMHKYAEGQPRKRYYQGNENVDSIEETAEQLALEVFKLDPEEWHVNVQPYSGTPANLAIYNALLEPGDKIMAMYLPDGGHLSHGWIYKGNSITFTSKIFDINFYHVEPETGVFDYDEILRQAIKIKPKLLISGGTAYPREIDHQKMGEIAKAVGAYYLADVAHEAGLIAGGANASPFDYADAVTMTTHKTLRGPRGALAFVRKEYAEALDKSIFPGLQGGPHLHTIAGIAVSLEKTKSEEFKKYAIQTVKNAQVLSDSLKEKGYEVVSGGTDKHLVLVDLRNRNVNGWFAAWALEKAGIIVNRNTVPGEDGSPYYPSGIRLGTPALTVRGMKEPEIQQIAEWIDEVLAFIGERTVPEDADERKVVTKDFLKYIENEPKLGEIKTLVTALTSKFPLPF